LAKGIADIKLEIAIERYTDDKASLEQGSDLAGVSLWRFLDELRERNVRLKYTLQDAEAEVENLPLKKRGDS